MLLGHLIRFGGSWQGQSASIFSKVPEDLLQKGVAKGWSKVLAAGKKELNGSAEAGRAKRLKQDESKQKRLKQFQSYEVKVKVGTLTNDRHVNNVRGWDKCIVAYLDHRVHDFGRPQFRLM
jgi:hypothetical protein